MQEPSMPLTGQPPTYTRGYSFTQHSVDQPNVPQPGDKLDQEFDDIATAVNDGNLALQSILNDDGTLQDASVGPDQLQPGLFDVIVDNAAAQLQPMIDQAEAASIRAVTAGNAAGLSAANAAASSGVASGASADAATARDEARAAADATADTANEAKAWAAQALNSANTSGAAMVQSLGAVDTAKDWAEYLAGPVEPAPPGWPEAVDDGMWSAKWWAVRASEIVGDYGNYYLGAFDEPPPTPSGDPWPPGKLYFDIDDGMMMVWDGVRWKPLVAPAPAIFGRFTYLAVDGQTTFSGPDLNGLTPTFNPNRPEVPDVHLNGVQLVRDTSGTGDYQVNVAGNSITLWAAPGAGAVVQWDMYLSPASLATGTVLIHKLNNPWPFDGVRTSFPMTYASPVDGTTQPATPGDGVQITLNFDGVPQEPGADFTTVGSNLVFTNAPFADSKAWATWAQPAP